MVGGVGWGCTSAEICRPGTASLRVGKGGVAVAGLERAGDRLCFDGPKGAGGAGPRGRGEGGRLRLRVHEEAQVRRQLRRRADAALSA